VKQKKVKSINVRVRQEQWDYIQGELDRDPEMDVSTIIRRALDERIARDTRAEIRKKVAELMQPKVSKRSL
jgi:hypothetical protein